MSGTEAAAEQVEGSAEESVSGSVRDILLKSPSYATWAEQDTVLKARFESVRKQLDAADEEERQALAKWSVRKFNALNQGDTIPPKPEPVDKRHLLDAKEEVRVAQQMHSEQKSWAIVAAMEDEGGLEAVRALEAADLPGILPLWEAMQQFLQRAAERAALVREYERMKASRSTTTAGAPRVERITARPDLYDVLAAMQGGRSLLDPAPVEGSERKIERVQSGYGMQPDGAFASGYADHDKPPPPAIPRWLAEQHRV